MKKIDYTDEKIEVKSIQQVANFKNCKVCGEEVDMQFRCKACKIQYLFIQKDLSVVVA